MNDQDEMFERGTETPAFLGCPQHMPTHLPGGFDGTEPGATGVSPVAEGNVEAEGTPTGGTPVAPAEDVEALKERGAKLKACNDRSRARMLDISEIASHCVTETLHENGYKPGQYGEDYRAFGKAFSEIRRLVKESIGDVAPDYEMLAFQFARDSFDFSKFQEAIAAVASMKQVDFPGTYYTPGWLVDLAKKLEAEEKAKVKGEGEERKHTMDFGKFHVTRAAIPGLTVLTFRRKRELLDEYGSLVKGRIIVAEITRKDVGAEKPDHHFTVKSYEEGEKPRVLFAGDSWVSMSKTEKMVYKMVKCDIKETQRRHITRKRKRDAAKADGEVK